MVGLAGVSDHAGTPWLAIHAMWPFPAQEFSMLPVPALATAALTAGVALFSHGTPTPTRNARITDPVALTAIVARINARVPSFSRQTKLSCAMCHNGFPQLTAFGRLFKLNGYTLTGLPTITEQVDSTKRKTLELSPIAPLSVMAIVSNTTMGKALAGTQGSTTQFPQQLSLFAATEISPRAGIFAQLTYTDQSAAVALDNVDLRFASHATLGDHDVLYGVTLHNNPTVQDVWNTLPAWGYPFTSSAVAPKPTASTVIDGTLSQRVLGLGAYALFNDMIYAELTGYTSAPQGAKLPLDDQATNTTRGISPYWRVALQHTAGETYMMVGTFGLMTELFPTGISGYTNQYKDYGLDAQIERKVGAGGTLIGRASYTKEDQNLVASALAVPATASKSSNTLNSYKLNLSWLPSPSHTLSAGIFGTSGTRDATLYPSGAVSGSAAGKPDSQGTILEWTHTPWLNTRIGAQYVMYNKFNGGSTSYDEASGGRNASHNNALYFYLWLAY